MREWYQVSGAFNDIGMLGILAMLLFVLIFTIVIILKIKEKK